MKKLWNTYAAKIDALTERERLLVMGAAVLLTVAMIYFAAIDPAERRSRMLNAQMQSQKEEIATLEKGGAIKPSDPDAANRGRIEALQAQIKASDETLGALQRDLVPADRMNGLLQEMLARDPHLTLISLRTLPVEPLVPAAAKPARERTGTPPREAEEDKTQQAHVYKHGVEITLQGTYTSLHDYLARLERSPLRMYWWGARLGTEEQPRLTLTVTVFTLSLDKAWLQV